MKRYPPSSAQYDLVKVELELYGEILSLPDKLAHVSVGEVTAKRQLIANMLGRLLSRFGLSKPSPEAEKELTDTCVTLYCHCLKNAAPLSKNVKARSLAALDEIAKYAAEYNDDALNAKMQNALSLITGNKFRRLLSADGISNELKSYVLMLEATPHHYDLRQRTPVLPGPSQDAGSMAHFASKASGDKKPKLSIGRFKATSATSKRHLKKKIIKGKSGVSDSEKDAALEFIAQQNIEDYMLSCQSASTKGIGINKLVNFPKTEYLRVLGNTEAAINALKNAFEEREGDREGPHLELGEKILLKALNQQLQYYLVVFLHALPVAEDLGKEIAINEEQRLALAKRTIDLIVCLDRVDEKHNRSIIPQIFTAFRGEGALEKA
ncbi:hypothetical protein RLOatenuis_6350 [Rickettsiales bacterium]|nr:hypothetical protein RLOatenuis_6350 [Rickettsiales bacterium]